jgi:gas vesicle protein
MPFPSPSRQVRRGLFALALALPLLSLASLAGAFAWVQTHGGLASSLTTLVRGTAFLASGLENLPGTLTEVQAATLEDVQVTACGYTWVNEGGEDAEGLGFGFALIEPDGKNSFSFSGSDRDRSERLDRLMHSAKAPTIWFGDDGLEYVVTDAATVERARKIVEPLQRIGREMGKVGGEMGRIGGELGRYGGRLGSIGGRLGGISARLATTRMSSSERDRLEAERDRLQDEMERVQAEMESLEEGSVHERQDELSRRMDELSKQHKEAMAKARPELRKLFDDVRAKQKGEPMERGDSSI